MNETMTLFDIGAACLMVGLPVAFLTVLGVLCWRWSREAARGIDRGKAAVKRWVVEAEIGAKKGIEEHAAR